MAPHKQPRLLTEITNATVARLLVDSCHNIESRACVGQRQWQVDIDTVQSVLEQHVPPPLWDTVCDAAHSLAKRERTFKNSTVLYSVLMHKNTRKLNITQHCAKPRSSLLSTRKSTAIWISLIERLVNLEEINVESDLIQISAEDFCRALGITCKKLQVVEHPRSTADLVELLRDCKQLRVLRYWRQITGIDQSSVNEYLMDEMEKATTTFPCLEKVDYKLENMREFTSMKRWLPFETYLLSDVTRRIRLCPHLQSLVISDGRKSEEIFRILSNSTLQLVELKVFYFNYDSGFQLFLESKGKFLRCLEIHADDATDLYAAVLQVGKCCTNLATLFVGENRRHINSVISAPAPGRLFQSLTCFKCMTSDPRIPMLCISHAKEVSSLDLCNVQLTPGDLITLLTPERLGHISKIRFSRMALSQEVVRHVYDNCPKLVDLDVSTGRSDHDVRDYLTLLKKKVIQNNLDLHIK